VPGAGAIANGVRRSLTPGRPGDWMTGDSGPESGSPHGGNGGDMKKFNRTTRALVGLGIGAVAVTAACGPPPPPTTTTTSLPVGSGLVINEVDYDQPGVDTAEFVEIKNTSASPIALMGVELVLVNGASGTSYDSVDLAPAGTLAAGQYLVVGGPAVPAGTGTKLDPGWTIDAIQNGAPDGVALVDMGTSTLIDALSYEGSVTSATTPYGTFNLVEGTPLAPTVADGNLSAGSLVRLPDGADTNDAATDWTFSAIPTPGVAN
jgi:large repetitive protein